jgi:hypothetical protein
MPDAVVSLWKDGPLTRVELQSLSEEEVVELLHAASLSVTSSGGHPPGLVNEPHGPATRVESELTGV